MPKYGYRCVSCGKDFDVYHSMFEVIDKCIICEADSSIQRRPDFAFSVAVADNAGKLVNETIEELKKEVKQEKLKLKEEFHD